MGQAGIALGLAWTAACGNTAEAPSPPQGGSSSGGALSGSGGSTAGSSGQSGSSGSGGAPQGGGSSGQGGGSAGQSEVTKYQACAAYMNAQCNRRYLECSGFPAEDDPCPEFLVWCPDFLFAEDSRLDVAGVLACAQKWRDHPCELMNQGLSPECGLLNGTRALGEPCYSGAQCASRRCGAGEDPAHPDCGACIPIGKAGDTCTDGKVACPDRYECSSEGCQPGITSNLPDGTVCQRYGQCYGESLCFPAPDGQMRCQPQRKPGEDCSNGAYCVRGATCGANGKCEMLVPAKLGELCYLRGCEEGGWCDNAAIAPDTTRCIPRAEPGAPCQTLQGLSGDQQGNCPEGMTCACRDATCTTQACVNLRHDGQTCDTALLQCIAGTTCQAGQCVGVERQGLEGAACSD